MENIISWTRNSEEETTSRFYLGKAVLQNEAGVKRELRVQRIEFTHQMALIPDIDGESYQLVGYSLIFEDGTVYTKQARPKNQALIYNVIKGIMSSLTKFFIPKPTPHPRDIVDYGQFEVNLFHPVKQNNLKDGCLSLQGGKKALIGAIEAVDNDAYEIFKIEDIYGNTLVEIKNTGETVEDYRYFYEEIFEFLLVKYAQHLTLSDGENPTKHSNLQMKVHGKHFRNSFVGSVDGTEHKVYKRLEKNKTLLLCSLNGKYGVVTGLLGGYVHRGSVYTLLLSVNNTEFAHLEIDVCMDKGKLVAKEIETYLKDLIHCYTTTKSGGVTLNLDWLLNWVCDVKYLDIFLTHTTNFILPPYRDYSKDVVKGLYSLTDNHVVFSYAPALNKVTAQYKVASDTVTLNVQLPRASEAKVGLKAEISKKCFENFNGNKKELTRGTAIALKDFAVVQGSTKININDVFTSYIEEIQKTTSKNLFEGLDFEVQHVGLRVVY